RLKPGPSMQRSAASTSGKYSGRQPAMTALAAIFSTVAMPLSGGITPSTASRANPPAAIIAATAASVGASAGSPSDQPRLMKYWNIKAPSAGTSINAGSAPQSSLRLVVA